MEYKEPHFDEAGIRALIEGLTRDNANVVKQARKRAAAEKAAANAEKESKKHGCGASASTESAE